MLSILGFQTQLPFGRKTHAGPQKLSMAYGSKPRPVQSQGRNESTYYLFSSSGQYILDTQGSSHGFAGHSMSTITPGSNQPSVSQYAVVTTKGPLPDAWASSQPAEVSSANKPYKIYRDTTMPDSFIYERSEFADSDTFTCYSNSSRDTLVKFPSSEKSSQTPSSNIRRNSAGLVRPKETPVQRAPDSPHSIPISLPASNSSLVVPTQGRPPPGKMASRQRSGGGDSVPMQRRGSASEPQPGPSSSRSSPPHNYPATGYLERPGLPPSSASPPRDIPPVRRESDPSLEGGVLRKRRSSGAVIPTGFGVLPGERLRNVRDSVVLASSGSGRHSPPSLRVDPLEREKERPPPDREVSPTLGLSRERRTSGTGANVFPAAHSGAVYDRDRPPMRRSSQSSGSTVSRERHSPQDEVPRGVSFVTGPAPTIRSRTISQGRISKGDAPKPIFVAGLESAKMVRFSDNLICPSPIPPGKRRKGWFNKRGDQLWTNDGVFVAADPGTEYPVDLADYPEAGAGWQNEEGVRIDMEHRLIPKAPLRPALKRGGSSATSQGAASHSDIRSGFMSNLIREEA